MRNKEEWGEALAKGSRQNPVLVFTQGGFGKVECSEKEETVHETAQTGTRLLVSSAVYMKKDSKGSGEGNHQPGSKDIHAEKNCCAQGQGEKRKTNLFTRGRIFGEEKRFATKAPENPMVL